MIEAIEIEYYETENGKCPYLEWESSLSIGFRAQLRKRLNRVRLGHFGDCKPLEGVKDLYELRFHKSPGYRVYFGKKGAKIIILLHAGGKGSQKRDISKATKYWQDCP